MKLQPESVLGAQFGSASDIPCDVADGLRLRERADIGCLLVTSAVDAAEIIDAVGPLAGVDLPRAPGMINSADGRAALWLSPRSWLIHCGVEEEGEIASRVNTAFSDKRLHAARFTDYLCWLELTGAGADGLLKEGSFVSLERDGLADGQAKRTLIAGIAAVVIRQSRLAWLIGVERSRARYFCHWLNAARTADLAKSLLTS